MSDQLSSISLYFEANIPAVDEREGRDILHHRQAGRKSSPGVVLIDYCISVAVHSCEVGAK